MSLTAVKVLYRASTGVGCSDTGELIPVESEWSVAGIMPREAVVDWKRRTFGPAASLFEFRIVEEGQ